MIVEKSNKGANDWNTTCTFNLADNVNADVSVGDNTNYFRVKMKNEVGESEPSPVVRVPPAVFPGVPKNVNCKHDNLYDQVTILWEQPTNNPEAATRYELEWQDDESDHWILKRLDGSVFTTVVKELNPRTKYTFRLRAVNDEFSMKGEFYEISATTKIETPGDPQKVYVMTRRLTCVELGWNAPETNPDHVKHYAVHICEVKKDITENKWQSLGPIPRDCSSITIDSLKESAYFHVVIQALNLNGDGGKKYIQVSTTYSTTEKLKPKFKSKGNLKLSLTSEDLPSPFKISDEILNRTINK